MLCGLCGSRESKQVCSGCQVVGYCSKTHQLIHWNHGHQPLCNAVTRGRRKGRRHTTRRDLRRRHDLNVAVLFTQIYPLLDKQFGHQVMIDLVERRLEECKSIMDTDLVKGIVCFWREEYSEAAWWWRGEGIYIMDLTVVVSQDVCRSILQYLTPVEAARLCTVSVQFHYLVNTLPKQFWRIPVESEFPETIKRGILTSEFRRLTCWKHSDKLWRISSVSWDKYLFSIYWMICKFGPWSKCELCGILSLRRFGLRECICVYHWGKCIGGRFDCCGGNLKSIGCTRSHSHRFESWMAM